MVHSTERVLKEENNGAIFRKPERKVCTFQRNCLNAVNSVCSTFSAIDLKI
jgi:hypothetical protein